MCRDGPRSGPGNLCCEAENLGPLRAPSRHKAAPTGICTWLEAGVAEVGAPVLLNFQKLARSLWELACRR
ncbi:protein of unknown function [Pseudomonas sp. JV551A1]|uniref:Uncharacterized protein n=1 Tax=Pseudomonas inefficax TaxID=2078786 RepID=A0AAQ1P855_9PSED|nr:protein of unknown function [Pseudomonas sp. JV551A1]SPO61053.1 protein of unknown function [Pseudomonas inefficax]